LLSTLLVSTYVPTSYAVSPDLGSLIVGTSVPDQAEIERQKQYELPDSTAWETDINGNKTAVPYKIVNSNSSTSKWSDGSFDYVYDSWTPSNYDQNPKRFFV
jgi:hypothetical protein